MTSTSVYRPGREDLRTLRNLVSDFVDETPAVDIHTHLFAPEFGELGLWGIDNLLTYHYLIAELFRSCDTSPDEFFELGRQAQADLIWETLFVRNTPLSEATRGVVAVLSALGLDPTKPDLKEAREFFADQKADDHLSAVLRIANVERVVMTNDPLDELEMSTWETRSSIDPRFYAALRMDAILIEWERSSAKLKSKGFAVSKDFSGKTISELWRFLEAAVALMRPLYLAVSLPDTFVYPGPDHTARLISDLVLPFAKEHSLPFALMIGVQRRVNPRIRMAGDGVGRADISGVNRLCADHPDNRFLVTMLSRENQHELCVSARKFSNLMPFGCWWFLNNPSIVDEITRERIEMLGPSFIPQHSDARVLEQLIYKWKHSREIITSALAESYERLFDDGFPVTSDMIERDVARLMSGNFDRFVPPVQR